MPYEIVKALDNIPLTLEFKFSTPRVRESEGQYGKFRSYSYGVVHQGVDKYFPATEVLNNLLSQLGDLRGRTLTLTLLQNTNDLKKKYWRIQDERENDITPSFMPSFMPQTTSDTTSPQTRPTGAKMEATEGLDVPKLKAWAKKTEERVKKLEDAIEKLLGGEKKEETGGHLSLDNVVPATKEDLDRIPY